MVLTAGHCAYGIGDDGEPTTGSNGNDVWINFSETPDFTVYPPSSDYIPDRNEERYTDRKAALNADPDWLEATAYAHPEYDDSLFYLNDLGVLVARRAAVASDEYGAAAGGRSADLAGEAEVEAALRGGRATGSRARSSTHRSVATPVARHSSAWSTSRVSAVPVAGSPRSSPATKGRTPPVAPVSVTPVARSSWETRRRSSP